MGAFAHLLLAAAALLTACSFGNGAKSFSEDGVSFRYPEGWHVTGLSTTNSPHRLAVASYPLPDDAVEGDCGGYRAVELLPPEGALVLVIDYGSAGAFPERSPELALREGEYAEYECFGPSTMFRFRVGNHDFQAHVALGPEAGSETRDRALAILESLEVAEPEPFVPATRREDDRLVMPLTFPDGTTAELVYPAELRLERFAIRPYSSGRLHGKSPTRWRGDVVGRDFFIVNGDVDHVVADMNASDLPILLASYEAPNGDTVGLWDVRGGTNVNYLGFQFGRWAVLVYDYKAAGSMTDSERASWVVSFRGRETDEGWLVLEAKGPLRLARAGGHAGPALGLGSGTRSLELVPGRCTPHANENRLLTRAARRGGYASWCLSGLLRIHANGDRRFVRALIPRLEVRRVVFGS